MKKIYLLVIFILGIQLIQARPVEPIAAKNAAINFYKQHTKTVPQILTLAYTETSSSNEAVYYVFNVNANDGFIIVSADNAAHPIIGYVPTGQFTIPVEGSNIAHWLAKKKNEIIYLRNKHIAAVDVITREWTGTATTNANRSSFNNNAVMDIAPLVHTTWDQSPYFNALCPGGSVTGCVATAMSQIMKYWSYPAKGKGSSSYTQTTNPNNYPAQSANYGTTTYNWANMPNSVSSANSDVATLLYQCGVSVDMTYDPGGSSSYMLGAYTSPCAQTSYVKYFSYDSLTIRGLNRSDYTDSAWTAILVNDLTIGRPIQYAGDDATQGGHSWVCDGYQQSNGFFHMNWGWGGYYNGYYSLDALNPTTYDFINIEQALIGIQPVLALPPVSDFLSATTTGCGSGSIAFKDQSSNTATSWSWTFSGGNPATSTLQNPVVTYSTPGTYSVTLQASNSHGTGTTVTKTGYITIYSSNITAACTPATTSLANGFGIGTFNVTLNTINNTSSGAVIDGGYQNFSCQYHTTLQASTVYTISVTVGATNNENIKVYIDYNNNGLFTDANELIYQASTVKGLQVGTFTTPASPVTGSYLRMRVLDDYYSNSISNACNSLSYGQAEDYGVYFASNASAPVAAFTSNVTSVCAGNSVNYTDQSTNSPSSWAWTFEGGTPPTSASQNPSITYTATGTYSVSLVATNTSGNNTKTINGYITVNAKPSASVTTSNVSCYGGSNGTATITPSGSATPFTYSWSPGGGTTGLSAGNYTYTITDNNSCKNTYTLNITQPAAITSSQSHTLCMGQSVMVGSSTYTANGTYTNTLTASSGCDSTVTTHVLVNTLPNVNASANNYSICSGFSDTLTASGAVTYTWSANAGSITSNTTSIVVTGNTTYTVMGTNANGCANSDTVSVTVVSCTTGMEQALGNTVRMNVWPNPALNNIQVSVTNNQLTSVKIYDVLGKEVMSQKIEASNQKSVLIDVSALPNSVYFVQVKTSQGTATQKIIVQH